MTIKTFMRRPSSPICTQVYSLVCALILLCCSGPALTATPAVDHEKGEISITMTQEPQWLNSVKATDQVSFFVLDHISEGLMTYDANGQLIGGVAQRWELTDDKATFWLRPDARWSDGEPVTAHDFVFAWQQVAKPANASEYAFLMRAFTNGAAITAGDMPPTALGVEALDDHTLVAHLASPIAYFLELVTFISFRPVREDFYLAQGQAYAADPGNMLSNGPFRLAQWIHGAGMRFEKNPLYWNADAIQLNAINVPYMTEDPNARFNLFMDERVVLASELDASASKQALQKRQKMRAFRDGSIFFVEFNHRPERLTRNLNLRRAMQSVFDAEELTYKVIGLPGNVPSASLFPSWLPGYKAPLLEEFPPRVVRPDVEQGLRYLELARQELGLDTIPPLSLLLSDTPSSAKQAEYFQNAMKRTLGLDIKLDKQIFKQRLAKMTAGDFDLVAAGWGPDYNDPMTFADLFSSWNMNNRGRYKSDAYDALVRIAQSTTDQKVRSEAFGKIQDLIYDDVVIIPQYERGYIYVQHKELESVRRSRVGGDPNYNYARIVER